MTINLLNQEDYNTLKSIFEKYPALTFQNVGYQYIDKSKFSAEEQNAFNNVTEILKKTIHDFVEFNNFCRNKNGEIQIRVQYKYDWKFTGVGYVLLDELLIGFGIESLIENQLEENIKNL